MFGFAVLSVFVNLLIGLLLIFGLLLIVNLVVYRSFKFSSNSPWLFIGVLCGSLIFTGILGTLSLFRFSVSIHTYILAQLAMEM
ncbi:hypothetical protein Pse7429DRAFT_3426 [Pseudanabaena biceps PCC 7429]|uniref:Uncharacterized protein n=1 Tax=Pseudanabaena biceps PCC 7429 TaxID=927668 RepID=L8MY42_9CYAN|nr:hypothetical protein Pse7429DRAFT_3426 [Pseudanabaena biceps PCC 7429]